MSPKGAPVSNAAANQKVLEPNEPAGITPVSSPTVVHDQGTRARQRAGYCCGDDAPHERAGQDVQSGPHRACIEQKAEGPPKGEQALVLTRQLRLWDVMLTTRDATPRTTTASTTCDTRRACSPITAPTICGSTRRGREGLGVSVASGGVELWSKRPLRWWPTPVVLWRALRANPVV